MIMATKDLITLARAYQDLSGVSGVDSTINSLITVCSEAIEKWCRRRFVSTAYDELYDGDGNPRLLLRQYPIQKVDSCRYRPVTVFKITNNTTANVQARVQVTSAGLTLIRVNAGVKTTDSSVTFAGNVTLTAVANAINALGNGWSAQAIGDSTNYGSWPSADLYVPGSYGDTLEGSGVLQSQGALQCVAGSFAELKLHTYELQGYQWDSRGWLLRAIPYTDPELLHPEDLIFPVGINNFRVQYTAGFTTVPEAVQEACAKWVAYHYYQTLRDPSLLNQVSAGGTVSSWGPVFSARAQPPADVRMLLAPYRRFSVASNQS
jgi:hypothetical protein